MGVPASRQGLLDTVSTTCKAVAERARHVRIRDDRLETYARSLPVELALPPALDPVVHYLGHGDDTVAFVLTLDAVNFGSGYFPHLRKRPGCSGYFTIASALTDHFRRRGPLGADELSRLTPEEAAAIFGQDLKDEPVAELMRRYAGALNNFGRFLLERFAGRFTGVLEAARSSAERLVRLLVEMPEFKDVACYDELQVAFYKRAQLTAADLALAFHGEGPGKFTDLGCLTAFADNLVPHVLRCDGILEYDDRLAARIEAGELIPAGSAEEVEIRACAVHAAELIVRELSKSGRPVTADGLGGASRLDYLLWNRGQQAAYKRRPRHRTRTVFY